MRNHTVIGRVPDGENLICSYTDMTKEEALDKFHDDLGSEEGVEEWDDANPPIIEAVVSSESRHEVYSG